MEKNMRALDGMLTRLQIAAVLSIHHHKKLSKDTISGDLTGFWKNKPQYKSRIRYNHFIALSTLLELYGIEPKEIFSIMGRKKYHLLYKQLEWKERKKREREKARKAKKYER